MSVSSQSIISKAVRTLNEHDEAESKRDVEHLADLKNQFKGAKQVIFMASEKVRRIYVNPAAIHANVEDDHNYPTVIVNDGGEEFQYHGAIIYGSAAMSFNPSQDSGKASIETKAKIVAFIYERDAETYRRRGC